MGITVSINKPDKPFHRDDRLTIEQLLCLPEGTVIERVHTQFNDRISVRGTIQAIEFDDCAGERLAKLVILRNDGTTKSTFLSDCGLVPYWGGKWNESNYVRIAKGE